MAYTPVTTSDRSGASTPMAAFQDASGNNQPAISLDTQIPTYRAAASFVPVTTGALTLVQVQGSATKTVRVRRISIGGSTATTVATAVMYLQRTSTAGTTGTAV
ncbi:MAG TPA: hypothetical protein VIU40_08285, partial [Geobacteraceae bacterium]